MIFGTGPNRPVQGVLFRPMLVANWDSSTFQIGILNEGEGKKEREREMRGGKEGTMLSEGQQLLVEAAGGLQRPPPLCIGR